MLTVAARAAAIERRVLYERLKPPPRLTLSEWSNRYRMLSAEASFRVGPYSTDDAPYQREPMDCISDPRVRQVVCRWGSQLGKTECFINNVVGYYIDQDPAPILVLQPTLEMAEAWSKDVSRQCSATRHGSQARWLARALATLATRSCTRVSRAAM